MSDERSDNIKNRTVFTGDNLPVLRRMADASVDLIYLDPPFNSRREYAAPIGSKAAGAAFKDTWTFSDIDEAWIDDVAAANPGLARLIDAVGAINGDGDKSYLVMMAVRLIELRRVLKETGSLYLHCDPTMSHSLKLLQLWMPFSAMTIFRMRSSGAIAPAVSARSVGRASMMCSCSIPGEQPSASTPKWKEGSTDLPFLRRKWMRKAGIMRMCMFVMFGKMQSR